MSFIKDEDNDRKNYILQDNKKTKFGATFIIVVLVLLIAAVAISGMYFEWF